MQDTLNTLKLTGSLIHDHSNVERMCYQLHYGASIFHKAIKDIIHTYIVIILTWRFSYDQKKFFSIKIIIKL